MSGGTLCIWEISYKYTRENASLEGLRSKLKLSQIEPRVIQEEENFLLSLEIMKTMFFNCCFGRRWPSLLWVRPRFRKVDVDVFIGKTGGQKGRRQANPSVYAKKSLFKIINRWGLEGCWAREKANSYKGTKTVKYNWQQVRWIKQDTELTQSQLSEPEVSWYQRKKAEMLGEQDRKIWVLLWADQHTTSCSKSEIKTINDVP